ncbi:glycosyltransferase family 4 protein [Microbacterium marinilacus]|uniref:D-inositol 3-phosphate glycosyltransferase n=1 Tax=Microbacterium marinilacus TaxID=415209 RepID=A0ABP7BNU3_9MICO|nr:glycosyltransferase family 4 protein [Microbacterium marinilacus]MBY0690055.1 glycosyltransferase family 4 protein [Microbacterium marinilacus]
MRIVLATSSYAPYVGGVEEHVRHVARVLLERGHDVVVWTVARDGRAGVREVDGVEVRDLPSPLPARSLRAILGFAWRLPPAAAAWLGAARSARADVLHVQCFGPNGTFARLVARALRVPLVVSSHGETLADDGGVFDASALARASLRAALARADAVTGCSQVVVDDLERRFGLASGRGEVVFNGIDAEEAEPAAPPGLPPRYVAAVGRLQHVKGFDLLIDAFAAASLPADVGLVIGGDGPAAEALRARAEERGVADRVRFAGRLSRAEVAGLFGGAAAVAVPSRFEAFGITALEAWRAGAPLVATTRGGPPEFVADGVDGLLRDPIDTSAFGAALAELVDDAGRARAMGAAGRARVPDFSWEDVVARYEAIYRTVTGDRDSVGASAPQGPTPRSPRPTP